MHGTLSSSGSSLMKNGFTLLSLPPYRHTLVAGAQSGQDRVFHITLLPIANTFKPLLATSNAYFENEGLPSKWVVFPCERVTSLSNGLFVILGGFYLSLLMGCLSLWMRI